ncbi:MAG: hypothetical protein JWR80_1773 [Bradyrhizobium sp.]|nr:hypothetical protein [Bradyrhizobium sp.]
MKRKHRIMLRRIRAMPDAEHAVFIRARYRGLDYYQIAAELDITVEEVERLMSSMIQYIAGWK